MFQFFSSHVFVFSCIFSPLPKTFLIGFYGILGFVFLGASVRWKVKDGGEDQKTKEASAVAKWTKSSNVPTFGMESWAIIVGFFISVKQVRTWKIHDTVHEVFGNLRVHVSCVLENCTNTYNVMALTVHLLTGGGKGCKGSFREGQKLSRNH